jgi:hypothetical protein
MNITITRLRGPNGQSPGHRNVGAGRMQFGCDETAGAGQN